MTGRIILSAVLLAGLTVTTPAPAEAVVYCTHVGVPAGCVARPGVGAPGVGVAPGVGAGAVGPGVRHGTPANRGGPVNRVGRH